MEELGEFDDDFKKKQEELLAKQEKFEEDQREYEEHADEIEAKEMRKRKIVSWAILALIFFFVVFLGWFLL